MNSITNFEAEFRDIEAVLCPCAEDAECTGNTNSTIDCTDSSDRVHLIPIVQEETSASIILARWDLKNVNSHEWWWSWSQLRATANVLLSTRLGMERTHVDVRTLLTHGGTRL